MLKFERETDHIKSIKYRQNNKSGKLCADMVYYINGKRHSKQFSGKTNEIIEEKIEQFKADLFNDELILLSPDLSFEKFTLSWLNNVKKYKVQQNSFNAILRNFQTKIAPQIGHIPMNRITYLDIQRFVNSLKDDGYAFGTISIIYSIIRESILYYRILTEQVYNPCEGIELPKYIKPNTDKLYYDQNERNLIENAAFSLDENDEYVYRYGPAIILMMYTGMRVSEATALTWHDINFKEKLIDINKSALTVKENGHYIIVNTYGGKTSCSIRNIPMSTKARWCLIELKKLAKDSKYVITTPQGEQVKRQNIANQLTKLLRDTNVIESNESRGTHSLRHTFASMLFENGCNVKIVSELLGHKSVKLTENTYIHVINKQKAKAISDLDRYCK